MDYKERVSAILARQLAFEDLITRAQSGLYAILLENRADILKTGSGLIVALQSFQNTYNTDLIEQLVEDIQYILTLNANYFVSEVGPDAKGVIETVETELADEFGFSLYSGVNQTGMLADIQRDTSLQRDIREFFNRQNRSGLTERQKVNDLNNYINGNRETNGLLESYYNRFDTNGQSILDSYQKADRIAQDTFSIALQLNASIYTGGIIKTTRPFCRERNGKIFLRSEIKAWKNLNFAGKPKNYDPLQDAGGVNCRHHYSWIADSTAIRLDKTLGLNDSGEIVRISS